MGLLNTPIIGRLVASVDSSSIDMLAGLSKWSIFEDPALRLRRCRPHGQQQRARCREHAKISLHFVRLLFVTRAEKTRIAAVPALFGLPCRRQRQRGYHLSDKRNRGSVSTFDRVGAGPPCRKGLLESALWGALIHRTDQAVLHHSIALLLARLAGKGCLSRTAPTRERSDRCGA